MIGQRYLTMPTIPRFGPIKSAIAYWIVWSKDFLDVFEQSGIDVTQWPDELPKEIVQNFIQLKESNGIEFARWKTQTASELLIDQKQADFLLDSVDFLIAAHDEEQERYKQRQLVKQIENNPKNAKDLAEKFLDETNIKSEFIDICSAAKTTSERLVASNGALNQPTVITGFEFVSKMIGGFNPGRVSILLADTGFGKTNAGIQLAIKASQTMPTAYANMEMISDDFTMRIATAINEVPHFKITAEHLAKIQEKIGVGRLFISDGKDLSVRTISSQIKQMKVKHGIKFVVIDYDQKLKLSYEKNQQEWQALQSALVALESISKSQGVHILVLAQTNDTGQISGSRRSMFPASTVLRFYIRDDNKTVIEAVKNRFGPRGRGVEMYYNPEVCLLKELCIVDPIKKGFL